MTILRYYAILLEKNYENSVIMEVIFSEKEDYYCFNNSIHCNVRRNLHVQQSNKNLTLAPKNS